MAGTEGRAWRRGADTARSEDEDDLRGGTRADLGRAAVARQRMSDRGHERSSANGLNRIVIRRRRRRMRSRGTGPSGARSAWSPHEGVVHALLAAEVKRRRGCRVDASAASTIASTPRGHHLAHDRLAGARGRAPWPSATSTPSYSFPPPCASAYRCRCVLLSNVAVASSTKSTSKPRFAADARGRLAAVVGGDAADRDLVDAALAQPGGEVGVAVEGGVDLLGHEQVGRPVDLGLERVARAVRAAAASRPRRSRGARARPGARPTARRPAGRRRWPRSRVVARCPSSRARRRPAARRRRRARCGRDRSCRHRSA